MLAAFERLLGLRKTTETPKEGSVRGVAMTQPGESRPRGADAGREAPPTAPVSALKPTTAKPKPETGVGLMEEGPVGAGAGAGSASSTISSTPPADKRSALERMKAPLRSGLTSLSNPFHSSELLSIPEDALQHGVLSIVDGKTYGFSGVAPILRELTVSLVAQKIRSGVLDINHIITHLQEQLAQNPGDTSTSLQERLALERKPSRIAEIYTEFMSQNNIFATEIEGGALADYFGMQLTITTPGATRSDRITAIESRIVNPSSIPPHFTISLIHSNPTSQHLSHYTYEEAGYTQGDGNCLFNAFAQAIAHLYTIHALKEKKGRSEQQRAYLAIMTPYATAETPELHHKTEARAHRVPTLSVPAGWQWTDNNENPIPSYYHYQMGDPQAMKHLAAHERGRLSSVGPNKTGEEEYTALLKGTAHAYAFYLASGKNETILTALTLDTRITDRFKSDALAAPEEAMYKTTIEETTRAFYLDTTGDRRGLEALHPLTNTRLTSTPPQLTDAEKKAYIAIIKRNMDAYILFAGGKTDALEGLDTITQTRFRDGRLTHDENSVYTAHIRQLKADERTRARAAARAAREARESEAKPAQPETPQGLPFLLPHFLYGSDRKDYETYFKKHFPTQADNVIATATTFLNYLQHILELKTTPELEHAAYLWAYFDAPQHKIVTAKITASSETIVTTYEARKGVLAGTQGTWPIMLRFLLLLYSATDAQRTNIDWMNAAIAACYTPLALDDRLTKIIAEAHPELKQQLLAISTACRPYPNDTTTALDDTSDSTKKAELDGVLKKLITPTNKGKKTLLDTATLKQKTKEWSLPNATVTKAVPTTDTTADPVTDHVRETSTTSLLSTISEIRNSSLVEMAVVADTSSLFANPLPLELAEYLRSLDSREPLPIATLSQEAVACLSQILPPESLGVFIRGLYITPLVPAATQTDFHRLDLFTKEQGHAIDTISARDYAFPFLTLLLSGLNTLPSTAVRKAQPYFQNIVLRSDLGREPLDRAMKYIIKPIAEQLAAKFAGLLSKTPGARDIFLALGTLGYLQPTTPPSASLLLEHSSAPYKILFYYLNQLLGPDFCTTHNITHQALIDHFQPTPLALTLEDTEQKTTGDTVLNMGSEPSDLFWLDDFVTISPPKPNQYYFKDASPSCKKLSTHDVVLSEEDFAYLVESLFIQTPRTRPNLDDIAKHILPYCKNVALKRELIQAFLMHVTLDSEMQQKILGHIKVYRTDPTMNKTLFTKESAAPFAPDNTPAVAELAAIRAATLKREYGPMLKGSAFIGLSLFGLSGTLYYLGQYYAGKEKDVDWGKLPVPNFLDFLSGLFGTMGGVTLTNFGFNKFLPYLKPNIHMNRQTNDHSGWNTHLPRLRKVTALLALGFEGVAHWVDYQPFGKAILARCMTDPHVQQPTPDELDCLKFFGSLAGRLPLATASTTLGIALLAWIFDRQTTPDAVDKKMASIENHIHPSSVGLLSGIVKAPESTPSWRQWLTGAVDTWMNVGSPKRAEGEAPCYAKIAALEPSHKSSLMAESVDSHEPSSSPPSSPIGPMQYSHHGHSTANKLGNYNFTPYR
jgi:hypothetical protein